MHLCGAWFEGVLHVPSSMNVIIAVSSILRKFGGRIALSLTNAVHYDDLDRTTVLGPQVLNH